MNNLLCTLITHPDIGISIIIPVIIRISIGKVRRRG